jgi:hypothetical protein
MLRLTLHREASPPVIFLVLKNSEHGETPLITGRFQLLINRHCGILSDTSAD